MSEQDARVVLARRLRSLREGRWADRRITQIELARALGGVSVPLISSWESLAKPRVPPLSRLDAYALLFATPRPFDAATPGEFSVADLTEEERQVMVGLQGELRNLRSAALRAGLASPASPLSASRSSLAESISATPWRFEDGETVTVVCAQLPQHMLDQIPYTNVDDPDYIELLTYSELDSLFELYGHLRAANPASHVFRRIATKMESDDYHTHLAVLGGIDWNQLTRTILDKLQLPVRQVADWNTEGGQYFEADDNGTVTKFRPVLRKQGGKDILDEDVALFARAVSPFNRERTVTICHGMYGRGTFGAVRALTDSLFRKRNSDYVKSRFGDCDAYCILTRVPIVDGKTLTPDWESGEHTLFEWPQ